MKLAIFAIALTCLFSGGSWATCKTSGTTQDHTTDIVVDDVFPVTQLHTSSVSVSFSDIKCDSATDKINYIPLVQERVIGPFSNGQSLTLKITLSKTSEDIGTTNSTTKSLPYTVTLTPATNGIAGSGGELISVPGVLVANTGGNSKWWIDWILGICKTLSLSGCVNNITSSLQGDSYVENLNITYRPKKTTCRAEDLTLKLPDVSLSELPDSGVVTDKSRKGNITLLCSNMVGVNQQATQAMSVYLYSADLLSGSRTILQGSEDNGIGFVVEKGGKQVKMSTVKGAKQDADNLWYASKGQSLSPQAILIPVSASYYVYARKAVKPGALQSTALIFVNYE